MLWWYKSCGYYARWCTRDSRVKALIITMLSQQPENLLHGPLTIYFNLRVAHAPGKSGKFSPPPTSKGTANKQSRHASRHVRHARALLHVGIANPRWRGKHSRYPRSMRNPQVYVSGKRPIHTQYFEIQTIWLNLRIKLFSSSKIK